MKKVYGLIIVVLLSFFSYQAYSQELASKDPQPRNVVLEEYTGIHCTYCPDGHARAKALADANPGRVVLINVHAGSYATPGAGEPDFRTQWGNALVTQSGLTGFPAGNINRQVFPSKYTPMTPGKIAMSRGGWASAANDSVLNGSISPVNLGMKTKWNSASRELEITVEMYLTSDVADNPKLNVVFLESHVWGPQTGGTPDPTHYEHNHILRDMITGQWGEEITSTTKGSLVTKTYKYTVSDKFVIENCDIAVYVTHNDNFNTYTGIKGPAITPNATLTTSGALLAAKSKDEAFEKTVTLKNVSDKEIAFASKILKSERTPADWTAAFSTGNGEATLAAGKTADITIKLTPGATIGIGDAELIVYEKDHPENLTYKTTITAISKEVQYMEVNAGGTMDAVLTNARPGFISLSAADAKTVDADLKSLKVIIYNTGGRGGLDQAGATYASQKISSGVGMLFAGSISLPMLTFDAPSHSLFSQLGITWASGDDIQLTSFNIAGVAGDPVSDGFAITAAPADNGNYYLEPMRITNTQKTVAMTKCTNVDKTVSVRVTNNNQKSIYLSFHLGVIKDEDVKNNFVKKSIDWIEGLTSAEEIDYTYAATFNELALTVAPNPATANSVIKYNLNAKSSKSMSLVLMNEKGQAVDQIWSGTAAPGEGTISFDFSKYAQGAYYLMLSSGEKSVTFPVTISR